MNDTEESLKLPNNAELPNEKEEPPMMEEAYQELPRCYPRNCRGRPVFRGNPEALAWALDNCSTTFVGVGAFLGTVSSHYSFMYWLTCRR
jgi:hypothetical protein